MMRCSPLLPLLLALAAACGEGPDPAGPEGAGGAESGRADFRLSAEHTWLNLPPRVGVSGDAAGARVRVWRVPDAEAFFLSLDDPRNLDPSEVPGSGSEPVAEAGAGKAGRVELPALPGGLYVVTAERGGRRAAALLPVGNLVLVTKRSADEVLVYAADAESGMPEGRVRVVVAGPEARAAGTTDVLGVYRTALAPGDRARVLAVRGGEVAIAATRFTPGSRDGTVGIVYPERPAARPGERISFKAVLRERRGGDLRIPAVEAPARFRVRDAHGALATEGETTGRARGAVWGAFTLPDRIRPGTLRIEVDAPGGTVAGELRVVDPLPPPFEVAVAPDARTALVADEVAFTIRASFARGVPLAGRRTRYRVEREKGPDEPPAPEVAVSGEGLLDERGELRSRFAAPRAGTWTIRVEVHDGTGAVVRGTSSVLVSESEFSLEVEPDRRHYTLGADRTPVVTIRPVFAGPRVPVEGELTCGDRSWPFSIADEDAARAYLAVPLGEPGPQELVAVARDGRGVEVRGDATIWIEDGEELTSPAAAGIRLIPDRDAYRPGEAVDLLVLLPPELAGAVLLLTVEGTGLGTHAVERAETRSLHLSVPVPDGARDRLRLAVAAIRSGSIHRGGTDVAVRRDEGLALRIETASAEESRVDATVRVRDPSSGAAVPAALSLALVGDAAGTAAAAPSFPSAPAHDVATDTSRSRPFLGTSGTEIDAPDPGASPEPEYARGEPAVLVRGDSPPSFFAAHLEFGEDDLALVPGIPVPPGPDRWQLLAVGVAKDGRVGVGRAAVAPAGPLALAVSIPRFLVQGDLVRAAFEARNDGTEPIEGSLRIGAEGLLPLGPAAAPIRVEGGGRTVHDLDLSARTPGAARLLFELDATGTARAERRIEVLPHGRARTETRAGPLDPGETSFTLEIPAEATLEGAELAVCITAGIGAAVEAALPSIADWRPEEADLALLALLLPIHAEWELWQRGLLEPPGEVREDRVPERMGVVLARQNADGGWGRFAGEPSDPATTARVHEGLRLAADLDLLADGTRRDRARDFLRARLERPEGELAPATLALVLRELALSGDDADGAIERGAAALRDDRLPPDAAADLLRVHLAGGRGGPAAELDLDLLNGAHRDAEGHLWWGRGERGGAEEAALACTAAVLEARGAVLGEASDEPTDRAVRFLLDRRRGAAWRSPRETALACRALIDVLRRQGDGAGSEAALEIRLGNALRGPFRMGRVAPWPARLELVFGERDLRKGRNRVRVVSRGDLPLRYAAILRCVEPVRTFSPEAFGLRVRRETRKLTLRSGRRAAVRLGEPARVGRGDLLSVEVTVSADSPREDVTVVVPIPAGTRPEATEGAPPGTRIEFRYDGVRFRLPRIGSEPVVLGIHLRATHRGRFQALPAVAFPRDDEGARGSSRGEVLYVEE